ncbi:MAG: aldehyde:ferredoxin oxidoreductase [Anaerolineaceae bacterium]|jgi:aldehyde:ferredoxin oxidoreductase|nr:MAG: aldehyde:ferredoxin oxidoreductase [Anaerolineaceae bacterium]
MPNGYHGKILLVDLSTRTFAVETPDDGFYRKYMGGSAMGVYYLLKNTPARTDPLDALNTLCFFTSVLTGAPISGLSRITVTAKSPTSHLVGDSQSGGTFPVAFKSTGYDGIVISGKSKTPVYLWITPEKTELLDASHLVGKFTADVEDMIREELGDVHIQIAQCGPAAENGVLYGAIITNANRANGRTGMGTVMASKNLKAIAVRGNEKLTFFDPGDIQALAREGVKRFPDAPVAHLGKFGTAGAVNGKNKTGYLPTRNWSSGFLENAERISGETMYETVLKKRDTCYGCVVRCKRVVEINDGKYRVSERYGGPEYETVATLGSYCGITDLEAICYANQLCNMYGMDTISCGATVAWFMDCVEHGYLEDRFIEGVPCKFGNAEAMVRLVELIAKQEGIGKTLGKGSERAAAELGVGQDLLVSVKNNEFPAHMPQEKRSLGLIYAVNSFGADHNSSEHDYSYSQFSEHMAALGLLDPQSNTILNNEKVKFALYTQYFYSLLDTLTCCNFVYGPVWQLYRPFELVDLVNLVTGWKTSLWELMLVGRRRLNLLRAFNAREGAGKAQDVVPPKMNQPLEGGPTAGLAIPAGELENAILEYYQLAGWGEDGNPSKSTLAELGLAWIEET